VYVYKKKLAEWWIGKCHEMGLVKRSLATKSQTLSDFYGCVHNKKHCCVLSFIKKITSVPIFRIDSASIILVMNL